VINRLSQLGSLPGGVVPELSPTSPIGEIYRYRIKAPKGYSVMDLKTLQNWILERRFKAIPGVIDVTGWGGKERAYEVVVDSAKLAAHQTSVGAVIAALGKGDGNVGGQTINFGPQAAIVRGVALIQSPSQIENTLVTNNAGVPVFIRDVASVQIGNQPRFGIAGLGQEDDIVEGIVLMRRGSQSMPTINAVKDEVERSMRAASCPRRKTGIGL
jgi:cobalt-zinc-cadmium resistance protein CzcA